MKLASSPSRNSSITTRAPASPKRPASIASRGRDGFVGRRADHDALAGREAVGLDHDRRAAARAPRPRRSVASVNVRIGGGRDAVARAEILGEGLGALELRRRAARAEAAQAGRRERVDDAEHQRRLGADDGEVDGFSRARSATSPAMSSAAMATLRDAAARARCRRCRARRNTCVTRGDCAIFQASACSRPPPPMIRTFMALRASAGSAACR